MDFSDLSRGPLLWRQMVERKEQSAHAEERTAIFMGMDIESGAPVMIPSRVLEEGHFHVSGKTGSGKTAASLMSLALQVLRNGMQPDQAENRSPLVIIDLKGDRAFFNTMQAAAAEAGRTFRYFSARVGDDYHFFDPFQIFRLGCVTPLQLASEFVRAFSLDYGLIYGGLYFTHQNLGVLLDAIKEMMQRQGETATIGALARILERMSRSSYHADARHIQLCLKFLAECEQVNIESQPATPQQTIDMLRALEDCEVVYFYLELESEAPSLRQIAALALYTLVHAAKERRWLGKPTRNTYVIIDEFYHIAGKSFGELLSTVRHLGLHFVLANQNRSQLENHDRALPSIVEGNTVVHQAFSLTAEEARIFAMEAGQTKEFLHGFSLDSRGGFNSSVHEAWTSRLSDDALKFVNDTRLASLLFVQDGTSRPGGRIDKVQTLFPLPKILYDFYQDMPLPKRPTNSPPFVAQPEPTAPAANAARPERKTPSAQAAKLHENMAASWRRLEAEEKY